MPGKCHFRNEWLELTDPKHVKIWLRKCDDIYKAKCTFCQCEFNISGSGISQVKSHALGQKHKSRILGYNTNRITFSFSKDPLVATPNVATNSVAPTSASSSLPLQNQSVASSASVAGSTSSSYFLKEEVIIAEILWCLHKVMSHLSLRACANAVDLFRKMFPDSAIAGKMELKKDKVAYMCNFGLGPYFQNELSNVLKKCELISISFDESLNKVAQKGQMDIYVRYWNSKKAETRYLTSNFLGKLCLI